MRAATILLCLFLAGCGHEFTGQRYKIQGGKKIGESVQGVEYTVSAEFTFDKRGAR